MAEKQKYTKFVTPKGVAVFPRLNKPDTKFNPDGDWSTKLRMPVIEEVQDLMNTIEAEAEKQFNETVEGFKKDGKAAQAKAVKKADLPFRMAVDADGNETGEVEFSFKQKAVIKKKDGTTTNVTPGLFDAKGKPFPRAKAIWGGSTIKVSASIVPYYVAGTKQAGVSLRLNGVQVLELVTGTGGDAKSMGFGEEEGYEAEDDTKTTTTTTADGAGDGEEDF